ncbi:large conductance mechanosensitive channel protein MscL [Nakamurella antarctica]|uniref:Large-conductance mechanosensitive channel n=1 Tax=Nakamurella antarctica TaxID=1902245 RepID=A0A3G8ZTD6_9ACTN|nr:large conductance mechanosensitive channel protein MscL [Nakamurella antarctica]AZI57306.1 large conductance mechanosensitive channel protein MscL [Nakamurella antarctica]
MLKGFRDFILRGNIIELAIAVVIGTAFTALVKQFSDYVINPILAAVGGTNSLGLGIQLGSQDDKTKFIDFGGLITAGITFVITAAVVYFVFVVPMNKISERRKRNMQPSEVAPTDSELLSEIRDLLKAQRGTNQG